MDCLRLKRQHIGLPNERCRSFSISLFSIAPCTREIIKTSQLLVVLFFFCMVYGGVLEWFWVSKEEV